MSWWTQFAKDSDPADWLDQKHAHQRSALEIFLADRGACPQRYLAEALPCLPFPSSHFDLVLSGHLMFSYAPVEEGGLMVSDGLDLDWHHAALIELCRVSTFEVRIYPAHTTALIAECTTMPSGCSIIFRWDGMVNSLFLISFRA